jgi:hypothetical protein
MMYSTNTSQAQGISAVKALSLAGAQGQKIYTITSDNIEAALSAVQLDADTEAEIRQGVQSGFVATAHEALINFNGWKGAGYIIFDPLTGSGAYKISGGKDGSYLDNYPSGLVSLFFMSVGILIALAGPAGIAAVLTFSILAISIFHAFITFLQSDLILKDSGCPELMSELLFWVTMTLFFLPKILKDKLVGIAIGMMSTIMKGAVTGAAPACKNLP